MRLNVKECKRLNIPVGNLLPTQPDISGFGPSVRALREERGLSRQELAPRAGLSPRGLEELEKPGSKPTLESAVGLAQALGTSIDDLMGLRSDVTDRLRLIRLLADPSETTDDLAVQMMKHLRRMMAQLDDDARE